jgi:hypothetical protein
LPLLMLMLQVERATAKMGEVSDAMVLMLVLEGCVLFVCAAIYIAFLIKRMVLARANLFSVFLVIPTGFLRALASKQVVLDEDADSDEGSDAGADVPQQRQEGEQQDAQKVRGWRGLCVYLNVGFAFCQA